MKVIRVRGTYRYRKQRKKRILTVLAVILIAAVVVGGGIFGFIKLREALPREVRDEDLFCVMKNGETATMSLTEGERCMLTLPESVDINTISFTVENSEILRVDDGGRADAMSFGKTVVTAVGAGFSAKCEFEVANAREKEPISERTTAITANADIVEKNRNAGDNKLYHIIVNRRTNTVTVYTFNDQGAYTVPVRAMVASCGTGGEDITPTGSYAVYFKERWHPLFGDVYGQYVTGFEGPYLFHSVPYVTQSADSLKAAEFNKLSSNASQGCVRLAVSDAKWIFENCPLNTPVEVIDDSDAADPLGTPPVVKVDEKVLWDPTDPDPNSPYAGKMPVIEGAADLTVTAGDEKFDPIKDIKAADICGNDITDKLRTYGDVVVTKPGTYYLTYIAVDDFKLKTEQTVTVTVTEQPADEPTEEVKETEKK